MTDLQSLRAAAEKAQLTDLLWTQDDPRLAMIECGVLPNTASLIAACDPQTVLSLLDRIRDLELDAEAANGLIISGLEAARRLDAAERVIVIAEEFDSMNSEDPMKLLNLRREIAEYREMSK